MARGTWTLIVLFLLASAAGGFLWHRSSKGDEIRITWEIASSPPLVMGVIPYLPEQLLKRDFRALTAFLSRSLQREVQLNFAIDYESLGRLLDLGKVQLAWFSANSFDMLNLANRWESICRPLREDAIRHRGAIVVREDSGVKSLADLKGKIFAYVDPHSGTGFVMPNKLFRSQAIDPLQFFGEVVFTGNHSTSIAGVLSGSYDAAAVFDVYSSHASEGNFTPFLIPAHVVHGVTLKPASIGGVDASGTQSHLASASQTNEKPGLNQPGLLCIAVTDWLLNDPVVVRKDMDPALKEKLRDQLVHMEKYPGGPEVLVELAQLRKWNGFTDERNISGATEAKALPDSGL